MSAFRRVANLLKIHWFVTRSARKGRRLEGKQENRERCQENKRACMHAFKADTLKL